MIKNTWRKNCKWRTRNNLSIAVTDISEIIFVTFYNAIICNCIRKYGENFWMVPLKPLPFFVCETCLYCLFYKLLLFMNNSQWKQLKRSNKELRELMQGLVSELIVRIGKLNKMCGFICIRALCKLYVSMLI